MKQNLIFKNSLNFFILHVDITFIQILLKKHSLNIIPLIYCKINSIAMWMRYSWVVSILLLLPPLASSSWNIKFYYMQKLLSFQAIFSSTFQLVYSHPEGWNINSCTFVLHILFFKKALYLHKSLDNIFSKEEEEEKCFRVDAF